MERDGTFVHANGIDIHYVEQGSGTPLLLLHGALSSSAPVWATHGSAYRAHLDRLAEQFRVIALDTRGSGASVHKGGAASFAVLVDDLIGVIDALHLDRPMVCGFSEGGLLATLLGITHPDAVRAIVNDAGYDYLNPQAPTFQMTRVVFGGSPEATTVDADAAEQFFSQDPKMQALFDLMKTDYDEAQGEGYWRTYLESFFERSVHSPGYTFDDLRRVTAPTLVMAGDRDMFCSVEEGVTAFRALPNAELAIMANTEHELTDAKISATIEFLRRRER